jgi:hypothetical protein
MTTNSGPAFLYHSQGVLGQSVRVKLIGTKSNRDGIGAVVRVTYGRDRQVQSKMLRSGSSYLSQSELVLSFGLGSEKDVELVEIQWPSGATDKLSNLHADQTIIVKEGNGQVGSRAYNQSWK